MAAASAGLAAEALVVIPLYFLSWGATIKNVFGLLVFCAACGGLSKPSQAVIDTLPSGAVHVRNLGRGVWSRGAGWTLKEVRQIGGGTSTDTLGLDGIWDLAVDSRGRIYIAQSRTASVAVYDSVGQFQGELGHRGDGPGEFRFPSKLAIDAGDSLWVMDLGARRVSVFRPDGSIDRSYSRPKAFGCQCGWIASDGSLIEGQRRVLAPSVFADVIGRVDTTGTFLDSLVLPLDREAKPSTKLLPLEPFAPRLLVAFDGIGGLWFGYSDRYRIVHVLLGGDTTVVVERDVEPSALSSSEIERSQPQLERFAKEVGLPPNSGNLGGRKRPMLAALVVDSAGNIWVARTSPKDEFTSEFDVFKANGRFLGTVRSPIALGVNSIVTPPMNPTPLLIHGNRLYGITRDADGIEQIVILSIVR